MRYSTAACPLADIQPKKRAATESESEPSMSELSDEESEMSEESSEEEKPKKGKKGRVCLSIRDG